MAALNELRAKPAGTVRLTTSSHAAKTVLWPRIKSFLRDYPDIKAEIIADNGLIDIVAERYDAGVRLGEQVAKDMIAVRIGPDLRMARVWHHPLTSRNAGPRRRRNKLIEHDCINLRLPTYGGLYVWEFEKGRARPESACRWQIGLQRVRSRSKRRAGWFWDLPISWKMSL